MRKSLNRCLFIRRAVGAERSLHSISELIREVFAEANYKINDLGMHMWEIE